MQEWVRTAVILGGGVLAGAFLTQALVFWRDERQRRRDAEAKRRERYFQSLQSLTETLAMGQTALSELANAQYFGVTAGAVDRVRATQTKLYHALLMGLPLQVHQPLTDASGAIWSLMEEGGGSEEDASAKMDAACEAVAK